MADLKLFIAFLGGKQGDDKIESHNLFFGVGETFESLLPAIKKSWKGVKKLHVDSWMAIEQVDGHAIKVTRNEGSQPHNPELFPKLLLVNIGFYKRAELGEQHRLITLLLKNESETIHNKLMKSDPDFFKGQSGTEPGRSHVDDQHNLSQAQEYDTDDVFNISEEIPDCLFEFIPLSKNELRIIEPTSGFLFLKELAALPE
ncbi:MAG: DUF1543 domain-containing protein [bacterium]